MKINISAVNYYKFGVVESWLMSKSTMSLDEYREKYPLQYYARTGNVYEMRKLINDLQYNINYVDYDGNTPLMMACQYGKLEMVAYLLSLGSKLIVNRINYAGNDALLIAAMENHYSIVRLLLQSNNAFPLNHRYESGKNILHIVAELGDYDSLGLLAEQIGNVDIIDGHGNTPLHIASAHGHVHQVIDLLDCGADINYQNVLTGETPLFMATRHNRIDMVNYLLMKKANKKIVDQYNETPIDIAYRLGHREIIELLAGV